jgi:hypothetical protein
MSMSMDPEIFFRGSDGRLMSNATNPVLTLSGCYRLCGTKTSAYRDSAPRLITWLLPITILIANMQFAPIGKERFLMVLHLLGDPIDSTWSLLSKVEIWNRCFSLAQELHQAREHQVQRDKENQAKNIAVIISAAEELIGPLDTNIDAKQVFEEMLTCSTMPLEEIDDLNWKTASNLVDSRTNEMLRTCFSILQYLFQVMAAFVPAIGEASSPSGGEIGTAMLLSWLLPVVLLSNAVGDFTSSRKCLRIVLSFMEQIGSQPGQHSFCAPKHSSLDLPGVHRVQETSYFNSLAWSGAIYSYRPDKHLFKTRAHGHGPYSFAFIFRSARHCVLFNRFCYSVYATYIL